MEQPSPQIPLNKRKVEIESQLTQRIYSTTGKEK